MPKPEYSSRVMVQGYLTQDQILLLLTADPETGHVCVAEPGGSLEWLIAECYDLGLINPGNGPGTWRLSRDGWDAWNALLD